MALPTSGPLSINNINVELGKAGTTQSSLGQTDFRTLAGVASGTISMSNFYGKANWTFVTTDLRVVYLVYTDSGFVTSRYGTYVVPSNRKVKKLKCVANVQNHVNTNTATASVAAAIQGYNGSSWVTLATGPNASTTTGGTLAYSTCYYTFPVDNVASGYTQFRFYSNGNSFRRGVDGYLDEYYTK